MKGSPTACVFLLLSLPRRTIPFTTLVPISPRHRDGISFRASPARSAIAAFHSTAVETEEDEDASTITTLENNNGQSITLIGTAHLSERSNRQVERIIQKIQPETVVIELDPARLVRIGIASTDELLETGGGHFQQVESACDIRLPKSTSEETSWMRPLVDAFLEGSAWIGRQVLTRTYRAAEEQMDARGGGEFLAAIHAAQTYNGCQTLVLADRSSVMTIQRALTLAWDSGDMWGLYQRLEAANQEEMKKLEEKVAHELLGKSSSSSNSDITEEERKQVMIAMMEQLKDDAKFRDRLFARLEREAPEFTQAFLNERDFIMGECIVRSLGKAGVKNIVGVVGLAHVVGIEKHLRSAFRNETLPLVAQLAAQNK